MNESNGDGWWFLAVVIFTLFMSQGLHNLIAWL